MAAAMEPIVRVVLTNVVINRVRHIDDITVGVYVLGPSRPMYKLLYCPPF